MKFKNVSHRSPKNFLCCNFHMFIGSWCDNFLKQPQEKNRCGVYCLSLTTTEIECHKYATVKELKWRLKQNCMMWHSQRIPQQAVELNMTLLVRCVNDSDGSEKSTPEISVLNVFSSGVLKLSSCVRYRLNHIFFAMIKRIVFVIVYIGCLLGILLTFLVTIKICIWTIWWDKVEDLNTFHHTIFMFRLNDIRKAIGYVVWQLEHQLIQCNLVSLTRKNWVGALSDWNIENELKVSNQCIFGTNQQKICRWMIFSFDQKLVLPEVLNIGSFSTDRTSCLLTCIEVANWSGL